MKLLVSGASGFLGSALCHHLVRLKHEVVAIVRPASSMRRLQGLQVTTECCKGSLDMIAAVASHQPEAIVHTACAYGRQGESLSEVIDANIHVGLTLLQALADLPARSTPRHFINTGTALPSDVSDYALSKQQFSAWGNRIATASSRRVQFLNLQLQHMYGPGDDTSKFTTHVVRACQSNVRLLPLTAGEQKRDFIYIDDVVDGYAFLLQRADVLPIAADVPLGSGHAPSIREYVTLVHELCASSTELQFGALPYRAGEAMNCIADLTLMNKLGWAPRWTLRDGLRRTIELETFE